MLQGLELTSISLASRSADPLLDPSDRDAIAEQTGLSHLEIIGNPFSPSFVDLNFLPSLSPGLRLELRHVKVKGEALADSRAIETLAFTGVMLASGSLNDILENSDLRRLMIDRCSNSLIRFNDRKVVLPDPPVSIELMLPRAVDLAAYSRLSSEFSVTLGRPRVGYTEFLPDHSAFIRDDNMISNFDARFADALFDFENLRRLELHNTRVDPEFLLELLSQQEAVDIYLNNNEYLPFETAA